MEVFIVEWLVWYGQYLVCTKYLIIELNGWYAQNTSSIEWLLWYAQNTGMHKILLPLNGCYGMHKILKILHSLTHQNITSVDKVSYYNANPLIPLS